MTPASMVGSVGRGGWLAAAVAGVALFAAGCGGSSPATTRTSSAGAQSTDNPVTQAYKYAACMRDHGVANFPDPHVSISGGSTQISMMVGDGAKSSPQFSGANTACRGILPGPASGSPAAQAQQLRARAQDELSFARCMRDHGINGFPDPNAQGRLDVEMIQAAGVDLTAPQVRTAALTCIPASNGILTRAAVMQATSGNPTQSGTASSSSGSPPQSSGATTP
jgi:hypothetical protein